jgi:hypothetical protein
MKHPIKAAMFTLGLLTAIPPADLFGQQGAVRPYAAARDYGKWEKEVAAYEEADRRSPPPKGGIPFIGSSTIRLWETLAEDYPEHKVISKRSWTEIQMSTERRRVRSGVK